MTTKSSNPRAFFVQLRAEIILYVVEMFIKNGELENNSQTRSHLMDAIIRCFEDYTRNQKGDIGSIVRIANMQARETIKISS